MHDQQKVIPVATITGERSIRFCFGNHLDHHIHANVRSFCRLLIECEFQSMIEEYVPSYHTVTLYVRNTNIHKDSLIRKILAKWELQNFDAVPEKTRLVKIPVCYEEEFAPDMERVMNHTGLSSKEIIQMHSSVHYQVFMIGFLPGFPYLGGLNEKLITPRLHNPRIKVPKGTVGIGGNQTGIYPLESPGGWNIIGRTPIDIYSPSMEEPFLIHAGDQLAFYPITSEEFKEMKKCFNKYPESIINLINL